MALTRLRSGACALAAAAALAPLAACAQTKPGGAKPSQGPPPGASASLPGAEARGEAKPGPAVAWNQAAVAKLAADLAKSCVALYDEYYDELGMNPQLGSGDAADRFRLKYKLQRIEEQTAALAGALAAGKGREETTPQVEDIGELADDASELLARIFVQIPLQQRIDAARALWVQLLPYYGMRPRAGAQL
jgi:hypothetical protein